MEQALEEEQRELERQERIIEIEMREVYLFDGIQHALICMRG